MNDLYLDIAIQYYVSGRSATFASSMPVAGNLYHHAVEMLLKSFLQRNYSADHLKKAFRHDLKKLWREFKNMANEPALEKFNNMISALNKFEDLRYPAKGFSLLIALNNVTQSQPSGPATKNIKYYHLCLEEIDAFFTAVLRGRVNSGWVNSMLKNDDSRDQYLRENQHFFI